MSDEILELRLNEKEDKLEEEKEAMESEKSQENQQPAESNIPTLQPKKRSHEEEEGSSNITPEMGIAIKRPKLTAKSIPNWLIEVLEWIKRTEMANSKLSTASWTFKQLCWPKLHGNVKTYRVQRLISFYEQDSETLNLRCKLYKKATWRGFRLRDDHNEIPIANIDPPKYITGFRQIHLYFLDGPTLEFLKNMLPFIDNILLHFRCKIAEWNLYNIRIGPICRLLSILTPKIHKLNLFDLHINLATFNFLFPGYIQEIQHIQMDNPRRSELDLVMKWLNTERADGNPKIFSSFIGFGNGEEREHFIDRVKQEFLLSKRKATFIIDLGFAYTEDLTFENEETGELLSIYQGEHWDEDYKDAKEQYLVRHPKGMEHLRTTWQKKFVCDDKEYTNVIVEIEEIGISNKMEERIGDDIFGQYAPINNFNLTMDAFMQQEQLRNSISLGSEPNEPQQQHYQNPASFDCWSPLKGKNREIIDSMSNTMTMPSTSTSNRGISASLNPLFSIRTPMGVGIESEEEEAEEDQSSSSSSTESEISEDEEDGEKTADNDDSDYEPTNEEEEEAAVEERKFNINRQQKNTFEKVRPKFDEGNGSNVKMEENHFGDDGIVVRRSRYANRKSQKGIPKDCGWEKVVEPAPNNAANFASDDVQQQQPAEQANNDGRVVFRRTRGRWQSNQWKFVTQMHMDENMEYEIKRKYGVYAYVRAKPTNLRCKRFLRGCTYKMLLRRNCEDVPTGFVHLYERNAHNHDKIEAPEGFNESRLVRLPRYNPKGFDDWRYIGRRWTVEQVMAHKKANGLRGHFSIQKKEKRQYLTNKYLHCGFVSSDGQTCEYHVRTKQNDDCIDEDEPTFTVWERGKHSHENTLEDVEVEDDEEIEMNDFGNSMLADEQIQQKEQSTSTTIMLENYVQMQCQQQNFGIEEEDGDEQDLEQFKLATEPISTRNPIVNVDLLMLVPKIAQSARALKSALASKRKRNKNGANQEERRKSNDDAPLWEGTMMMQNLAKRISENRARTTTNEGVNQQQQPSTSSSAATNAFDFASANITQNKNTIETDIANLRLEEHNLEQQQSNSIQIIKPIPKKTVTETDANAITNAPIKIKWRHVGQCTYSDFYKKISTEPWVLYGKNGMMYYYKCARETTNHNTPCNFRIRLHRSMECNNQFGIYESGQHSCGFNGNSSEMRNGNSKMPAKDNRDTSFYRLGLRKIRNRVMGEHYRLGKMERWKTRPKEINWYDIPGEWTREKMYQRARDEHGLRLYAWKGMASLYFECEQIGSDGLQCEFKLRGLRIAKQATEKTTETATNANDDQMRESSSNIGQVEPQTTSEDSSQYIYKLSETADWHNHETTVLPIGRAQYNLKNVDLSKWKFVKDVHNIHQFHELRSQLRVLNSSQHFRLLKQDTMGCALKTAFGPTKKQCPYCILVFRDFQHGPIHVYEKGEHKHSITDENDDEQDYFIYGQIRKRGYMDEKPWMLINENVTKEELFLYAEKVHELEMYLRRHCRWIYFKCNKYGPDDRLCQFKICGKMIDQKGNGGAQMDDDIIFMENADQNAEELNANNQENTEEGDQPPLYNLFETKYYHNHECTAPISEKRYVGMNKNDVFDDANGQWNLKTTIYDWEDFQDLKRTENLPTYCDFLKQQRINLICCRKGCKYRLQTYRQFIGDPMKVYVQNEGHNHPQNEAVMSIRHRDDVRIDGSIKTYFKNTMQRSHPKPRIIAQLRPTIIKSKSNKRKATIFEQIIQKTNLDGPQMSLEQFCQEYWRIEQEEQKKEGESENVNGTREEVPEGGNDQHSIEGPENLLLSSPMPTTSSAIAEKHPIPADQQNMGTTSEMFIPILGQGPSAFKKPASSNRRSTSLMNETLEDIVNIELGPMLSNIAPPQLSSISTMEGPPFDVQPSEMFSTNSSTSFSDMPTINRVENVPNCQELPSSSTQIQQSIEQQHSWHSLPPSTESQKMHNDFDMDTNSQENYTEFLDFDESNQAPELSSNPIQRDQNEENTSNFGIHEEGNNNYQNEAENDNVFSPLAPPLSPMIDVVQIDEEDENQIAVSQTMTSLLGAIDDEATNAIEHCENGVQTTSEQFSAANHLEKWTKLSTNEKLKMGALYGNYLQKWRINQQMKKVINRPKVQASKQRSGKIVKKAKKRRGLFVTTRGAKQRMEEEKRRRREFVPQRRGAYLDDSSEDENGKNGNENDGHGIEILERQEFQNADTECNQNEDDNIGGEFREGIENDIEFMEDTNEEEMGNQESNMPSTSQKAFSTPNNKQGRVQPQGSTKKAAEKEQHHGQKTPISQKAVPKEIVQFNQNRLLIVNISCQDDPRIEGIGDAQQSQGKSVIRYLHKTDEGKKIGLGQLCTKVLDYLFTEERAGKLAKGADLIRRSEIINKIGLDRSRCAPRSISLFSVLEALEIVKTNKDTINDYVFTWQSMDGLPVLMESFKRRAEAIEMPQKIASIEKKLRKMSATEACGRNAANIIRETVADGKIFTDEPTEDGGKKLIRQICRRFLMILLCVHADHWAFGLDMLIALMGCEPKFRRQLYDIVKVLTQLKLIKKLHYVTATQRIPIYTYSGQEPDANPLNALETMVQNLTTKEMDKNPRDKHQEEANNGGEGTSNAEIKHEEELADLRHCLEQGFGEEQPSADDPCNAPTSPAHSTASSTGTIPTEINEDQLTNQMPASHLPSPIQMPAPIQLPPRIPLPRPMLPRPIQLPPPIPLPRPEMTIANYVAVPATIIQVPVPNPIVVQPYFMQFPPIVRQMNAQVAQQTTQFVDWQRPDCLADVGAEAVIGDEVEEIVATGELIEIKVEEEGGERQNIKNRQKNGKNVKRRTNRALLPMTAIKTHCSHGPIAELHGEADCTVESQSSCNNIASNSNDLAQIQSTSNAPQPAIDMKPDFDSIGEVLMEAQIPITGDEEADDRRQLETMPLMTAQSMPKKKKQQKRRANNQNIASPNAKRLKPNESGPNSKSKSTPAEHRGRGRPFGSTTKKLENVAEETPAPAMPNRINNNDNDSSPTEPRFNLRDFDNEQLALLGAEWGLELQKRDSHLLFFKPAPAEEEVGPSSSRKSRILRHTTMGLLLMDNGDHVQVDECELMASDGSYRPNTKPTDRWFKGKASGKKFLRCLHKKMAQCFGETGTP